MKDFGSGPTLREACHWLADDAQRRARILDVTERNSVIEGLPPFQDETRRKILADLAAMAGSAPQQAQPESRPPDSNPQPAQSLEDWTGVYDGLSDAEIEAVDEVAKTRVDLTRNLP